MDVFNPIFLPNAYGLNNTGSICYFNSLLQVLAGCTSIFNIKYDKKNILECVFSDYIEMIKNDNIFFNISNELVLALNALVPSFGNGQESASEAFILLIEKINNNKLTNLFLNRFKCSVKCNTCNFQTEELKDHSITFNIFHTKDISEKNMLTQLHEIPDYICEKCKSKGAVRKYKLTMLPEIIFCTFNIYYKKIKHNFPLILNFPGINNNIVTYKMVGQIEHSGTLNGGHYWARSIRKNGIFLFNDNSFNQSIFEPTDSTYIVVYHMI